jgi:hypothetical protein
VVDTGSGPNDHGGSKMVVLKQLIHEARKKREQKKNLLVA